MLGSSTSQIARYVQEMPITGVLLVLMWGFSSVSWLTDSTSLFALSPWSFPSLEYARQILTFSLVHGDILHLLLNSLALTFLAWPLEKWLGKSAYTSLLLTSVLVESIIITLFSTSPVVGMSGFILACLTVYVLRALETRRNDARWWVVVLVLAVFIWSENVSIAGHLWGAIGGIVWYLLQSLKRR